MKSFQQFVEQAAAAAPAPTPTPSAPAQSTQKVQKKVQKSDPSAGVDKDKYGRWESDVVDQGEIKVPGRTDVKPGIKGPDPNLPTGAANPNRKRDLDALMNKAPGTHTPSERQALLDAGLDDFVRGGKTASPVGDAAMLAATYGLVKGGGALAGRAGVGAAASRFGRSGVGAAASRFGKGAKNWWNKGRNTRIPNENQASWKDLMRDDLAQRGQSDAAFAAGRAPRGIGRPDQAFNPFRPASKGGPGSGPTPAVRQAFERPVRAAAGAVKKALGM